MEQELRDVLGRVFIHGGFVKNIALEWTEGHICIIHVTWIPWSSSEMEHMTSEFIESGILIDDKYLYLRINNSGVTTTATITVDMNDKDWQRNLVRQMSLIIASEIREAVSANV